MYNRGLRKHKGRRNPREVTRRGMPKSKELVEKWKNISAARAFLLRNEGVCRAYDNKRTPPLCDDPATIPLIDRARKIVSKADRRNYRRQIKNAAKKLMKNIKFFKKGLPSKPSETEVAAYESWEDGKKSLTAAIAKALETENSRLLKEIAILNKVKMEGKERRARAAQSKIDKLRPLLMPRALDKVRTYFVNTKNTKTNIHIGVTSTVKIESEGLDEGDLDFPPKIKPLVFSIFEKQLDEIITYIPADVYLGIHDSPDDDSGEFRAILGSGYSSAEKERHEKIDSERAERQAKAGEINDEPSSIGKSRSKRKKSNGKHHKWEQVVGPTGEDVYFEMQQGKDGKCILDPNPKFEPGDIILDMTAKIVDEGVVAWEWHRPGEYGRIQMELTATMMSRYKSSFLYLVRLLAVGRPSGLSIKQFHSRVEKKGLGRTGSYRRKNKLKKRKKR